MTAITSGSNATISVAAGQILTVQSDGATFDYENPVGTRIGEYGSDMTFGPFTVAANVKLTSIQGPIVYELATPEAGGVANYNPANVVITGGTINGARVDRMAAPTRSTTVRVATFGDSTASVNTATPDVSDVRTLSLAFPGSGATVIGNNSLKFFLPCFYPQAYLVANCGITGTTSTSMVARDTLGASTTRKAVQDALDMSPDVVLFRGGSINDLGSVTSSTWKSTADTSFDNHKTLISRMLAGGVVVIDEGIYGYGDGTAATATDPVSTRLAVKYFNTLCAQYAASFPGKVYFVDPVTAGLQASDGKFIASQTADGIHLSNAGSITIARQEAALFSAIFGPSSQVRYPGVNLATNALLHSSSSGLATGFNLPAPTNATWGTQAVEIIDGKMWQTAELLITGTSSLAVLGMYAGIFPLASVSLNDTIGWEYDVMIQGKNGYIPRPTDAYCRFDILKTGNGRIVHQTRFGTDGVNSTIVGHMAFQPYQFTDVTTIVYASTGGVGLSYLSDEVGATVKLGISSPRMVKL